MSNANIKEEFLSALEDCYNIIAQVSELERRWMMADGAEGTLIDVKMEEATKKENHIAIYAGVVIGSLFGLLLSIPLYLLLYQMGIETLWPTLILTIAGAIWGVTALKKWIKKSVDKLTNKLEDKFDGDRLTLKLHPELIKYREMKPIRDKLEAKMDDLILNQWPNLKKRADVLAREAYYEMGLYQDEYEGVLKANDYLQSATTANRLERIRKERAEEAMRTNMKILGVAFGIAAVATIGFAAMASSSMKNFGGTPNNYRDVWIDPKIPA